ncbi:hypothetical protein [Streptosporangium sp. NPDC004631]
MGIEQRSNAGARLVPGASPAGATTMRAALSARVVRGRATALRPGDEVFGRSTAGTLAESACVPADNLLSVPANLSVVDAPAVPASAMAALQALRKITNVRPGQTVLVTGTSGGVGSFAVQIAKAFGAEETGVCSTRNLDGAAAALRYVAAGHTRGKVVVTV